MKKFSSQLFLTVLLLAVFCCAVALPLQVDIMPKTALTAALEDTLDEEKFTASEGTSAERTRTVSESYPNFIVYEIREYSEANPYGSPGYEIESEQTGKVLLQFPPEFGSTSAFYPMEDGSLLCSRGPDSNGNTSFWRLYSDGTKSVAEEPFSIVSRDTRGRFLVEQCKEPAPAYAIPAQRAEGWRYGILDKDFETVLLPIEYGGPSSEGYKGVLPAHFFDGYIILRKDGKYGLLDYNLQVKLPFVYDSLNESKNQIYSYQRGDDIGVIFLDNEIEQKGMSYQFSSAALTVVQTSNGTRQSLIDRNGDVLFTADSGLLSFGEDGRPEIDGQPLKIPRLDTISPWAEASIDAARSVNLFPSELDQRFQYPATRREFCMLAMQLMQILRPELVPNIGDEEITEKNAMFWDCTRSDLLTGVDEINAAAKLGIIAGCSDGSFAPFAPVIRQDAAVILANTAQLLGVEARGEPSQFTDLADAAGYAQSAIQTVSSLQTPAGERLMGGDGGKFLPQQPYTIEQAIATMYRLYTIAV